MNKTTDDFEEAERFQRLFVKPMVDALKAEMAQQLQPIVQGQRRLFVENGERKTEISQHSERLHGLESKQRKALIGWGALSLLVATVVGSAWGWVKARLGI